MHETPSQVRKELMAYAKRVARSVEQSIELMHLCQRLEIALKREWNEKAENKNASTNRGGATIHDSSGQTPRE